MPAVQQPVQPREGCLQLCLLPAQAAQLLTRAGHQQEVALRLCESRDARGCRLGGTPDAGGAGERALHRDLAQTADSRRTLRVSWR